MLGLSKPAVRGLPTSGHHTSSSCDNQKGAIVPERSISSLYTREIKEYVWRMTGATESVGVAAFFLKDRQRSARRVLR